MASDNPAMGEPEYVSSDEIGMEGISDEIGREGSSDELGAERGGTDILGHGPS